MENNKVRVSFKNQQLPALLKIMPVNCTIRWRAILKRFFTPLTALLLMMFSYNVFAQTQITGTVTDESTGENLPGVNVFVEGTTIGTITDMDGKYTINAPDAAATMVFSFVGYVSQSIPVGNKTIVNVQLAPDVKSLDEVVVVGYGTMKKSDVTGAIVSLKADDYSQVKAPNIMESLQGKAAGVEISRSSGEAGTNPSVLIRGERSLSGSNGPLYIIDGVQSSRGTDLNPNEIASIEILKDISSTSIYGAKGANGVIIITTKKGMAGKPKITFSTYVGINKPLGKLPYMDRNQYLQYKEDIAKFKDPNYISTGIWPDSIDVSYTTIEEEGIANGTNTDWLDLVTRTGYLKDYYLSVSGGKEDFTYNLSIDYTDEKGMIKQDDYKRYLLKGGMEMKVNKFLSVGTSSILTYKNRSRIGFPEKQIRLMNPLAEPYDSLGNPITFPSLPSNIRTPLWSFIDNNYTREELNTNIFSNVFAEIKFFNGLTLHSNLNVSISGSRTGISSRDDETLVNVEMSISPSKSYALDNILTFDKTFGIHHIQLTAVQELQKGNSEKYRITGNNPQIPNSYWYALNSLDATSIIIELADPNDSYYSEGSQLAYLGRLNYTLMGKYVATASLRYDGSSVLAEGNKWDYFPSASIAWNISEENFLKPVSLISQLKLRLSYGTSGNYSVPAYSSIDMINTRPLYYEFGTDEEVLLSYRPAYTGNDLLSWEKTSSFNIGLDFGLMKNRISGNIDAYKAYTNDILQDRALPPHAAIPSIYDNIGKTETRGIELMLNSINFSSNSSGGFKWSTDFSLTCNDEKIVELASGVTKDEANGWFVGSPLDVWYYYEMDGIWQYSDSSELALFTENDFVYGDIKIKDQNNDSIINEDDRIILMQRRPKWYGSITNRFEYKGFDLSILIVARMGMMVEDGVMNGFQIRDDYSESGFVVDYWTPVNPSNEAPRLSPEYSAINYVPYSGALLYTDGSWIKIKDITLGYTFPRIVLDRLKISNLRIFGSAKNCCVLYSPLYKKGRYDPENAGRTSWPIPKTYTVGLTLDF